MPKSKRAYDLVTKKYSWVFQEREETVKRIFIILFFLLVGSSLVFADDLSDVKKRGVLRHLGVPYANFVTDRADGLDVELMRLFAAHLGVQYVYVQTSWENVIPDLVGKKVTPDGDNVKLGESTPIRGDVIANGFTILPWRQKVLAYTTPTFPNQVWLITRTGSEIQPIKPTGNVSKDIEAVKSLLAGRGLLGKTKTCLDPSLYKLQETGAKITLFGGNLNELAPAVINRDSETAILDVPDALVALGKWPGQILVIGPVSAQQEMGVAFRPSSPELLREFNKFFDKIRKDGTYRKLVEKYYPAVFSYYPDFFVR
jgi:ABC-type amino acid transport substrate-binding protein